MAQRGRPPKPYPKHELVDEDRDLLAARLRHGYRREGPFPTWYKPAEHERPGDEITAAWLDAYKAMYPADWRRMRRNTRHAERGNLKGPLPRYTTWRERTAKDNSERDVAFIHHSNIDSATTGGSHGALDTNDYLTSDLARFHWDADSFSPEDLLRLWETISPEDLRYHYEQALERLMTEAASVLWFWSPPVVTGLPRHGGAWLDSRQRSDDDRDEYRELSKQLRASRRFLSLSRLLSVRTRELDSFLGQNGENTSKG